MKKFLGILAIAGTLVACNNSSDGTATGDTSTNKMGDTNSTMNTNTTIDTNKTVNVDTTIHKSDTTKK